jgi:hypothetical protein
MVFDLPRETDWSRSVVYIWRLRPGSHGIWVDYLKSGQLWVLLIVLRMNRLAVIAHMSWAGIVNAAVYQTWSRSLGHIAWQWSPWSSGGDDCVYTRQLIVVDVTAVFMCRPLLVLLCLCALPWLIMSEPPGSMSLVQVSRWPSLGLSCACRSSKSVDHVSLLHSLAGTLNMWVMIVEWFRTHVHNMWRMDQK